MEDLCTSCLCAGRKLCFIWETAFNQVYTEILNEIPIHDLSRICIKVCWECRALLRKLLLFKDQVKRSYAELLEYATSSTLKDSIAKPSQLAITKLNALSYPLQEIKIELEEESHPIEEFKVHEEAEPNPLDVKIEAQDEIQPCIQEHCESETFVNDYNPEVSKETKKKTIKVSEKEKGKKKAKLQKVKPVKKSARVKKKKSVSEDSFCDDRDERDFSDVGPEESGLVKNEMEEKKDLTTLENLELNKKIEKPKRKSNVRKKRKKESSPEHSAAELVTGGVANGTVENEKQIPVRLKPKEPVLKDKPPLADKPQCVECGKIFSSRKTYRYHLNVLHRGQNRYPCPRCGQVYQWKSNLGRHLRTHKARDSGELYCSECDKRFASVATYRQHLRVSRRHVPESQFSFTCDECGKKFVNKTRLRDHIDWEHLKKIKFRCQVCNKAFKCHTSLYVHAQNVHRNKDMKNNLCHVCGKSYQNTAKLKYHIVAMHTAETPYRCAHCDAAFGWYSSLYRHVREVHYKMKVQPKKSKKTKKLANELLPTLLPHHMHQPGTA